MAAAATYNAGDINQIFIGNHTTRDPLSEDDFKKIIKLRMIGDALHDDEVRRQRFRMINDGELYGLFIQSYQNELPWSTDHIHMYPIGGEGSPLAIAFHKKERGRSQPDTMISFDISASCYPDIINNVLNDTPINFRSCARDSQDVINSINNNAKALHLRTKSLQIREERRQRQEEERRRQEEERRRQEEERRRQEEERRQQEALDLINTENKKAFNEKRYQDIRYMKGAKCPICNNILSDAAYSLNPNNIKCSKAFECKFKLTGGKPDHPFKGLKLKSKRQHKVKTKSKHKKCTRKNKSKKNNKKK
jgi:hypothetical protein